MPAKRIDSRILTATIGQWEPGIQTAWSVSGIRSALANHQNGQFDSASRLVESMGQDDELPGVLEKRVDAVLGSEFRLRPPDDSTTRADTMASELEQRWWDIAPECELDSLLRWYRMLGVGVATLDWERSAASWEPRLRTLHPQFLRWDSTREAYYYNTRESAEVEVTPGDGRWVLLVDGSRGWLRGAVRGLALAWACKAFAWRDWQRYNERHGLPIIKALAPAVADIEDKDAFADDLRALGSETSVLLPTNLTEDGARYDLELLEARDGNWQAFEGLIDRVDRRYRTLLLGNNLTTEVDGQGSRAAAEVHRGVEQTKAKADAEKLATALREQIVVPIVALNYGQDAVAEAPWPSWDTSPPDDLTARAAGAKTLGEAITAISSAGYEIANIDEIAEKHGLELAKRAPMPGVQQEQEITADDSDVPGVDTEENVELSVSLASGDAPSTASGFVRGQQNADAIVEQSTRKAARIIRPDVQTLLDLIAGADSFQAVRSRLASIYAGMDPGELAELTERALILSELNGRAAVLEDL